MTIRTILTELPVLTNPTESQTLFVVQDSAITQSLTVDRVRSLIGGGANGGGGTGYTGSAGPIGPSGPAGSGGGGTYTLPVATTTILGGVKVDGTSIAVSAGGVISAVAPTGAFTNMDFGTNWVADPGLTADFGTF